MIKNEYKCPNTIWNKFKDFEKEKYNKIRGLIDWKEIYHTKIKNDTEIIEVTAHNIACQLVWNGY